MLKYIYLIATLLFGSAVIMFTNTSSLKEENKTVEEFDYAPIVVLELFTSQGCSSCPSADVLLQKVKKEYPNKVYALSYHVDYWNYIGWEDPFSNLKYSKKQQRYNKKFNNRSNYTPQLVINGKEHLVGSNSSQVYAKIDSYEKKRAANHVEIKAISVSDQKVSFNYNIYGDVKDKIIRTILVLDERTTQVKRGENRNRRLKNSNVVVAERSFSLEDTAGSMKILIPEIVKINDGVNLIVLVETKDHDITGAAKQNLAR